MWCDGCILKGTNHKSKHERKFQPLPLLQITFQGLFQQLTFNLSLFKRHILISPSTFIFISSLVSTFHFMRCNRALSNYLCLQPRLQSYIFFFVFSSLLYWYFILVSMNSILWFWWNWFPFIDEIESCSWFLIYFVLMTDEKFSSFGNNSIVVCLYYKFDK